MRAFETIAGCSAVLCYAVSFDVPRLMRLRGRVVKGVGHLDHV